MRHRVILTLATGLGLSPVPVLAQEQAQSFAQWSPSAPFASPTTAVKFGHPADYRWEGVAVGSAIVGIFGFAVGYGLCLDSETRAGESCLGYGIGGLLMGATVGGVTGGLIGGLIPKQPQSLPQSP